jgi:MFS family permease
MQAKSEGPESAVRNYAIVTLAYWADTVADGAIRMLVLFYFYQLGYSALQVASLFLFYEFFGILTNLFGGYLASRFGLKSTLFLGLGIQVVALSILAVLPGDARSVSFVMISQALSGIAKDLTKMSSKSAVKLVAGESEGRLYRWVALLTGSKNALKGFGFFLGGLLLSVVGFQVAVQVILVGLLVALVVAKLMLKGGLGVARKNARFKHLLSRNRAVNILSVARLFLFGARDVWFVVALPVFLSTALAWKFWQTGAFMAAWVIGYGAVQAFAPALMQRKAGDRASNPDGRTAQLLAFVLALLPVAMASALIGGLSPAVVVIVGLLGFGVIFALNSAVHSYLILVYADHDKVAMNVGVYYMANACGRLIGTLLSGWLYQLGVRFGENDGMVWCLLASSGFLVATGLISLGLPARVRCMKV